MFGTVKKSKRSVFSNSAKANMSHWIQQRKTSEQMKNRKKWVAICNRTNCHNKLALDFLSAQSISQGCCWGGKEEESILDMLTALSDL